MSIYVGAHRAKLCRGDWRPATLYKGEQYIAGAMDSEPATLPCAIEDTYNDHVMLTALGKGRQECTTGKNLFDSSAVTDKNFVGLSVKYLKDEDCFLIDGLSTGTYSLGGDIAIENTMGKSYSLSSRYVSGQIISPGTGYAVAYFGYKDTDGIRHNWASVALDNIDRENNAKSCTFETINSFWFYINAGWEFLNYKVQVQFEESAAATGYEPYTGGMPSPNPEYPQPLVASGGSVSAHGKNLIQYPYESTTIYPQAEKGAILTAYAPYRGEPTQITLPTLRAIPDGSGGWTARDSMTPAPHMPGWYDVVRRIEAVTFDGTEDFVLCDTVSIKTADIHAIPENFPVTATNIKYSCSHCPQVDDYRYLTSYSPNNMSKALEFRNIVNMWGAEEYTVAAWQAFLAEQYAAKTPVTVWYVMAKPTTERVYLGELKSYPQYTYISANGDYLPDMTATARKEQI